MVTSFIYHDCAEARLCVIIAMAYANGQLSVLSEPESTGDCPVSENLAVQLASSNQYQSHVLFLREEHLRGNWRFCQLQPTMLSPIVTLTEIEFITDVGMFCSGPIDPWSSVNNVASATQHAIY